LKGERSGTFYPFWDVIKTLIADGRAPKVIALENVLGTLTSHEGRDFAAICQTFANAGYRYGALVINAALFLPQSRPRLFVIGVRDDVPIAGDLIAPGPLIRSIRQRFAERSTAFRQLRGRGLCGGMCPCLHNETSGLQI
jgi:DNA (cytosine-5)-methyltransferase 1